MGKTSRHTTASINRTCAAHEPLLVLSFVQRLGRFGFASTCGFRRSLRFVCKSLILAALPRQRAMCFGSFRAKFVGLAVIRISSSGGWSSIRLERLLTVPRCGETWAQDLRELDHALSKAWPRLLVLVFKLHLWGTEQRSVGGVGKPPCNEALSTSIDEPDLRVRASCFRVW